MTRSHMHNTTPIATAHAQSSSVCIICSSSSSSERHNVKHNQTFTTHRVYNRNTACTGKSVLQHPTRHRILYYGSVLKIRTKNTCRRNLYEKLPSLKIHKKYIILMIYQLHQNNAKVIFAPFPINGLVT